jgi:hypothetical protein
LSSTIRASQPNSLAPSDTVQFVLNTGLPLLVVFVMTVVGASS